MTHADMHALTGAYALDALDGDEHEAFEAHLAGCDACRAEVDGFLATAASLGAAAADTPPSHLREAVLAEASQTRQDAPAPDHLRHHADMATALRRSRRAARRAWRDRLLMPAAAVMAVVVAGLAVVVGNLNNRIDELSDSAGIAAVAAADDLVAWEAEVAGGGTARVLYSPSRGEGWFLATGLEGVGENQAYELWLIDDSGPSPAGLFDATGERVEHAFTGDMSRVRAVAVTVEPASGSPRPTSDPVVVVEL